MAKISTYTLFPFQNVTLSVLAAVFFLYQNLFSWLLIIGELFHLKGQFLLWE